MIEVYRLDRNRTGSGLIFERKPQRFVTVNK
jgi:hypothetical protein